MKTDYSSSLKVSSFVLMSFALALICIGACDNAKTENANANAGNITAGHNQNMKNDSEFAMKAAQGGMYEVEMGKLAEMKGMSEPVKELGRMMASDHGKANEELKALAARKSITLPASMNEDQQKEFDKLAQKAGAEFDKAYADMMVSDHEKDLKLFRDEAKNGSDEDIKSFAQGKVSVLEHHLMMAEQTKGALKNEQ